MVIRHGHLGQMPKGRTRNHHRLPALFQIPWLVTMKPGTFQTFEHSQQDRRPGKSICEINQDHAAGPAPHTLFFDGLYVQPEFHLIIER